MKRTEFNALKNWIEQRTYLCGLIDRSPQDRSRTISLRKEVEELDTEIASVLVTEEDQ